MSPPKPPPADPTPDDTNPQPGIPKGVQEAEPKGRPTSDRQKTETAAAGTGTST